MTFTFNITWLPAGIAAVIGIILGGLAGFLYAKRLTSIAQPQLGAGETRCPACDRSVDEDAMIKRIKDLSAHSGLPWDVLVMDLELRYHATHHEPE